MKYAGFKTPMLSAPVVGNKRKAPSLRIFSKQNGLDTHKKYVYNVNKQ